MVMMRLSLHARARVVCALAALLVGAASSGKAFAGLKEGGKREPRTFDGVSATFRIAGSPIRRSQPLRISFVLRNHAQRSVAFRYLPPSYHARVYSRGVEIYPTCDMLGEMPYSEVTLKPGVSVALEDEFHFAACYELMPGRYTVRFYYHLALFRGTPLEKQYVEQYHAVDGLVPWDNRSYSFTVVE
jgi:hypothetical protein